MSLDGCIYPSEFKEDKKRVICGYSEAGERLLCRLFYRRWVGDLAVEDVEAAADLVVELEFVVLVVVVVGFGDEGADWLETDVCLLLLLS